MTNEDSDRRGRYYAAFSHISRNIRYFRKKKQLNQTELAEKAGVSRGYISALESSTKKDSSQSLKLPSFDLIFTISEITEANPRELIARDFTRVESSIQFGQGQGLLEHYFQQISDHYSRQSHTDRLKILIALESIALGQT